MTFFSGLLSKRFAATVLLALVWLLIVRASYVVQSGLWPNPAISVLSDVVGALLLAVLLTVTRGMLRALFIGLLGCAAFAAGMHLAVHGTLFRLTLIGRGADPTFLVGSLVSPELIWLPLYLGFAWLLHRLHRHLVPEPPAGRGGLLTALAALVLVYAGAMPSLTTPANNVVASSLAQIPVATAASIAAGMGAHQNTRGEEVGTDTRFFHQKVAAPEVDDPPNVLLIMVEGMSGGYFPEVSDYHDLDPAVRLEQLQGYLTQHGYRIYRNALSMERQTDRGTFAILCGGYPNVSPEADKLPKVAKQEARIDCMPEHLSSAGYHTAYWQAAPLEYLEKHRFMPRIGFDEVTGAEVFAAPEDTQGWGPPDPVYFKTIGERLQRLDAEREPWMVTLLNVGTHHPFDVGGAEVRDLPPRSDTPLDRIEPQQARRQAMNVMEESLTDFLNELATTGVLDNTLVIVTADESGGFVRQDQEALPLSNNIGALAVRPPDGESLEQYAGRDRIVAQVDIPLTILDAAGIGHRGGDMIGRSLLAEPGRGRDLLLADTYTGMKYFLRESGRLLACSELTTRCTSWRFNPDRLFGSLERTDDPPFLTLRERLRLIEQANYIEPNP